MDIIIWIGLTRKRNWIYSVTLNRNSIILWFCTIRLRTLTSRWEKGNVVPPKLFWIAHVWPNCPCVCVLRRAKKKRFMSPCLMGTWWHYHWDHFSVPQMCPSEDTMTAASMLRAAEIREAWCPAFKSLQNSF